MNNFTKFFVWAGGFDIPTAQLCTSSEINKMTMIGISISIPPVIGLFSYTYALNFVFDNIFFAVLSGIILSLIIFFIDRSIIAFGKPNQLTAGVYGRFLLALVIGLLLSEPVVLKIFEDSINEELVTKQITNTENIVTDYDQRIEEIEQKLLAKQDRLDYLQDEYTSEMDGTGGSGIRNQGPIYKKKYADYLDYKKRFDQNKIELKKQISELKSAKAERIRVVNDNHAMGLIGRMRALSLLGDREPVVAWTTWLLRFFFVLIELIPVFIKISPSSDKILYYQLVDQNDEERLEVLQATKSERFKLREKQEEVRIVHQFYELCNRELEIISSGKVKDSTYLMNIMQDVTVKKFEAIRNAKKKVKNSELLDDINNNLEDVYNGFVDVLKTMVNKSNNNFNYNQVL